ncbi:MAG: class I SAM-dependent methyltransferase [Anaerolineales bacterium]|nr:class I SAM-dependent methyltransferase [Anaerolineales bacterium]
MLDLDSINLGFSRKAAVYDAYGAENLAVRWTRAQVRAAVLRIAPANGHVLELNSGTGADAAYFVQSGLRVHATDVADGMLAEIHRKIERENLAGKLTAQKLSFLDLEQAQGGPFDVVFSNFGGLNCVPLAQLRAVAEKLPSVLKPGGALVWVLMPPICPWEIVQATRGRFSVAFRRVRGQTRAHVEGAYFSTYYFRPSQVIQFLRPHFSNIQLQSLSLFSPPAFMEGFPRRWPRLFQWLTQLDARICRWPLLNSMGDFFILAASYSPLSHRERGQG